MKKIFYVLPGLCLFASGAAAEAIDSVSFNPARLGRYETLKVSDQLTTKGGIEANAVTVQSGGTVSVNNAGNYKFPVTEVLGSVDMKSTDFEAVTLNSRGTASFENKSSSAESKITTLNTSTADVRANILDLTSVTVPDEDENSLRLGENDIPRPASVGLDNCSNLTWVERTADDNYKYKVLAFGSCAGGETETPECLGDCSGGPIWKDCTQQNGGEAWCYKYDWDKENCKFVKSADNPSWGVRCPALDGMFMASGTCSCEEQASSGEGDGVWKRVGTATLFAGQFDTPVLTGDAGENCGTNMRECYVTVNRQSLWLTVSMNTNSAHDPNMALVCSGNQSPDGTACDFGGGVRTCFTYSGAELIAYPPAVPNSGTIDNYIWKVNNLVPGISAKVGRNIFQSMWNNSAYAKKAVFYDCVQN